jgi:hypothetical protein
MKLNDKLVNKLNETYIERLSRFKEIRKIFENKSDENNVKKFQNLNLKSNDNFIIKNEPSTNNHPIQTKQIVNKLNDINNSAFKKYSINKNDEIGGYQRRQQILPANEYAMAKLPLPKTFPTNDKDEKLCSEIIMTQDNQFYYESDKNISNFILRPKPEVFELKKDNQHRIKLDTIQSNNSKTKPLITKYKRKGLVDVFPNSTSQSLNDNESINYNNSTIQKSKLNSNSSESFLKQNLNFKNSNKLKMIKHKNNLNKLNQIENSNLISNSLGNLSSASVIKYPMTKPSVPKSKIPKLPCHHSNSMNSNFKAQKNSNNTNTNFNCHQTIFNYNMINNTNDSISRRFFNDYIHKKENKNKKIIQNVFKTPSERKNSIKYHSSFSYSSSYSSFHSVASSRSSSSSSSLSMCYNNNRHFFNRHDANYGSTAEKYIEINDCNEDFNSNQNGNKSNNDSAIYNDTKISTDSYAYCECFI